MLRFLSLILTLLPLKALADGGDCSPDVEGSCNVASDHAEAFMQRKKKSATMTPRVPHASTVNLLLTEMDSLVNTRGEVGLSPDEIAHVHSIRMLINSTIIPSILESVQEAQAELDELFESILRCEDEISVTANTSKVDGGMSPMHEYHTECRQHEDELITRTEQSCTELNRTKVSIHLPAGEPPAPDVDPDVMLHYLKLMDEVFCLSHETFLNKTWECENDTVSLKKTHASCTDYQKRLETTTCSYKTHIGKVCEKFTSCWTKAVARYNERKAAIKALEEARLKQYLGAKKIECLWEAWHYEMEPCMVNHTMVEICHDLKVNFTNLTIIFPPLPPPPPCNPEIVTVLPCAEDWVRQEYGSIGLSKELLDEVKRACEPCPDVLVTYAPTAVSEERIENLMFAGEHMFLKTEGEVDMCDGMVYTPTDDAIGITYTVVRPEDHVILSMKKMEDTFNVTLENDMATPDEGTPMMVTAGDVITMDIIGDTLEVKKNDNTQIASIANMFSSSVATVYVCTMGATVKVDFTHASP